MNPEDLTSKLDALKALKEQLAADATSVTDEQLAEAQDAIREIVAAQRDAAPSPDTIAALTDVKAVKDAVKAEQSARTEESERVNAEAQRLLADLDEPEAPAAADGGETAEPPAVEAETVEAPEPVLASGNREMQRTNDQVAALVQVLRDALTAKPATIVASGDKPAGRSAAPGALSAQAPAAAPRDVVKATAFIGANAQTGREITSNLELARAIHERWRGGYQSGTGRMPILHVDTAYPDNRILGNDASVNYERIQNVVAPQSLVAAGGLCAPLETLYDVEVIGSAARPIRDALARFAVERGGIQYRPNTSAASAVNGAGIWTLEDDERVGVVEPGTDIPDPTKGCYVVDCPGLEEAVIQAIYSCLEFSNITARFDPETTASNVVQGGIAHARVAENALLSAMQTGSKLLRGRAQEVGAVRHVLGELDRAVAYYRNRHRLDSALPLTWMAPHWFMDQARADLAYQMAAGDWQDALGVADSAILSWFSRRGVTPVWHMDGTTDATTVGAVTIPQQTYDNAAPGSVIPTFPTSIDSLLFTSGSWLFLDGGSLDLGLVRDHILNARNRYRQFMETFEGVADRGIESLRLVVPVEATGATSGTVEVIAA